MWFDRLSQKQIENLPIEVHAHRYQFVGNKTECLNRHSVIELNNLLVSDGNKLSHLNNATFTFSETIINEQTELLESAIKSLGAQLDDFTECVRISPLLPQTLIDSSSRLSRLELKLEEVLSKGHLHHIAIHPRIDMKYIDEVTDVAKAKRLAKNALVHLASHSECWQKQTLTGILPKKVNAVFSQDEYNIYENRVFSRLVDKLELHLSLRLRKIDRIQKTLDQALDFFNGAEVHHRLSKEICLLWGKTFDEKTTTKTSNILKKTAERLNVMLKKIKMLKNRGVYLNVPRQARVGAILHRTNILNHDPHYQCLVGLWDQLNKETTKKLTPKESFEKEQELAWNYTSYLGLVLHHAFRPYFNEQTSISENGKICTEWGGCKIFVECLNFEWQVQIQDESSQQEEIILKFIPWYTYINKRPDQIININNNVVIVWPNVHELVENSYSNDIGWLELNPSDLYCVERTGVILDRVLNQYFLTNYAKPVKKIPLKTMAIVKKNHSRSLEIDLAKSQIVILENNEDTNFLSEVISSLKGENALSPAREIEKQFSLLNSLRICPVCSEKNRIVHQSPHGFKIECNSCKTSRYLRRKDNELIYEQKLDGMIDFKLTGRCSNYFKIKL